MRQTIEQWEEDHCRPFLVHDTRYIDKIDDEVHQHNIAKEKEKTKRVRGGERERESKGDGGARGQC